MDGQDALSFEFEENPAWRKTEEITTSTMLKEISKMAEDYEKLPEKAKEFSTTLFARSMAVEYVHHSNIGESVGTQAPDDTKNVLERLRKSEGKGGEAKDESAKQWSTKELETINTCKALGEMYKLHEEMDKTGLITMQQLCDVHRSLLEGLHKKNGRIRIGDEDVYTNTEDGPHHYPSPKLAEQLIYSTIDHHNSHMEYLRENQEEMTTLQKAEFLFKSAAWLLFHFVDTHPFCDGNGRMCRLLGNYVLSLVTPFPVSVYHIHPNRSHRDDYINAIVCCRKEGPRELAAMMVEGAWFGWRSLFRNLESSHMQHLKGGVDRLGPIVVKKSQLKDEELVKKVERVCRTTSTLEVAKAIEVIKKAIDETDVSLLEPFKHYLVKDALIHGTMVVIVLNIYY